MWSDTNFVFGLLAVTAVLMASNRLRYDVIALLVMLALMISGVLTVGEALAGFGSPVVILVAVLLVVGEMLDRTGVAATLGDWVLARGGSNLGRLYIVIMLAVAIVGSFMSSTAIVAIFIPIVLRIARDTGIAPSRLLLPMSYAALISGMLTLVATAPNIVVSEELAYAGYSSFGFFSFTPVGVAVLLVAVAYMVLGGHRLLPATGPVLVERSTKRKLGHIWEDYRGHRGQRSVLVTAGSSLAGTTIGDSELAARGMDVLALSAERSISSERQLFPDAITPLAAGDRLLLIGVEHELDNALLEMGLETFDPAQGNFQRWLWDLGAASILIHPDSSLIGKTLAEADFSTRFHARALGLRRRQEAMEDFADIPLAAGDCLLVAGGWPRINAMREFNHDFVILEVPEEEEHVIPAYRRRGVALAILVGMVMLSVFDVVPLVAAVLLAALAAGATGCLSTDDAYRAIHWKSVVLVAGMLSMADALEKTGGTQIVVDSLMSVLGGAGPGLMLTALFFLTAVLGLFLSNTASAVLVAPIAIYAAEALGVSPYPFAVAVLIAASAAFMTPVSTPVVTLVVEPGGYRFSDFLRVGTPLLILTWLTTLLVAPLVFPYAG